MTRGSRADMPSRGGGWVDYSPPSKGWEYWEHKDRFGRIPEGAKRRILRELHFFRAAKAEYERTPRRDLKQLKRDLAKVKKTGKFPDEGLQRFAKDHTLDFAFFNPEAGLPEKIENLLAEIETDPSEFMISGPKPQILYTLTLFDLFSGLGLNVSRGSAGDLVALTDKDVAPATPFVEFLGRLIWGVPADRPISVKMAQKIQRIIVRRSEHEQGE